MKFSRNGIVETSKTSVTTASRGRILSPGKPQVIEAPKGIPKAFNLGRNGVLRIKIGTGGSKTVMQKRNITPIKKIK